MESFLREAFSGNYTIFSVLLLVGLVDLLIVYLMYRYRQRLTEGGQETTGTVIDVVAKKGPKGETTWYPVFRFRTYMNEEITIQSKISSSSSAYRIGDEVSIIYDPEKPKRFILKNDKRIVLVLYFMGILAAVFLIIGLYGLWPLL